MNGQTNKERREREQKMIGKVISAIKEFLDDERREAKIREGK